MNIQGFVFNWKGRTENAIKLERALGRVTDVRVINSDEGADVLPHWTQLDDSAYFTAQWNKALELFDADVMFHVQADVVFDDFERLFARAREVFRTYPVGAYEPKTNYPPVDYNRARLRRLDEQLFEVPATDCTCWFIAAPVLAEYPRIDASINPYGWGVPATVAAICRRQGRICAKDYSFLLHHMPGRGYSQTAAAEGKRCQLLALEQDLAADVVRVCTEIVESRQP